MTEQPSDPTQDPSIRTEILRLRGSIDNIDASLMYLLAERFKCTERVGELKAQGGVAPADHDTTVATLKRIHANLSETQTDDEAAHG